MAALAMATRRRKAPAAERSLIWERVIGGGS